MIYTQDLYLECQKQIKFTLTHKTVYEYFQLKSFKNHPIFLKSIIWSWKFHYQSTNYFPNQDIKGHFQSLLIKPHSHVISPDITRRVLTLTHFCLMTKRAPGNKLFHYSISGFHGQLSQYLVNKLILQELLSHCC